jgi:hypothetical protein
MENPSLERMFSVSGLQFSVKAKKFLVYGAWSAGREPPFHDGLTDLMDLNIAKGGGKGQNR